MASERIISADSHVGIRDDAVLRHLPTKHHDAYKQARMEYIGRLMARAKRKGSDELPVSSQDKPWEAADRPGEYDPIKRLEDMDTDGVEAEVLYSDIEAGAGFNAIEDGGRLAAFRAFNDAALEFASADPKRLLVVYLLPIVAVDEAVSEVERLAPMLDFGDYHFSMFKRTKERGSRKNIYVPIKPVPDGKEPASRTFIKHFPISDYLRKSKNM